MRGSVFLAVLILAVAPATAGRDRAKLAPAEAALPLRSQRTDVAPSRPVTDAVQLGEHAFTAVRTKKGLRVALEPGADAIKAIGRDTTLTLRVPSGESTRPVRVHFAKSADGWTSTVVEAREIEIDGVTAQLVDLDHDGRLTVEKDGWRTLPSAFVVPLTETLIVGRHHVVLSGAGADGMSFDVAATAIDASRHQLDGLIVINELRAANGLPPVDVDTALSDACSAHAAYLLKNKWRPTGKMNPHGEVRGWKLYSDAGHRAGQMSVIAWGDHGSNAQVYWDTYYHRFPLAHPGTSAMGLSDGTPSISVIDGKSATDWAVGPADGWSDPILVPADGAVDQPAIFHRGGESPEPVDKPTIRGFPLTVQFLAQHSDVSDFRATMVEIDRKGREKDVPLLTPLDRGSGNRFGVIPERALISGRTYRVTYTFTRWGEPQSLIATFKTR